MERNIIFLMAAVTHVVLLEPNQLRLPVLKASVVEIVFD